MSRGNSICHRQLCHAALALLLCLCGKAQETQHAPTSNFQGKLLVVACDTDMLASAYVDGKLGPALGPDVLSVIRLGQSPAQMQLATVEVSNSVVGPPASVAVTPDGHYAIVVESQGPRPPDNPSATMKDLAPGRKITVVDIANPDKPTVAQQFDSYEHPAAVAINAAGTLVAISFAPKGHVAQVPLVIYRFHQGKLLDSSEPKLPGFTREDELSAIEFLPGKDVLGVVYTSPAHPRLSFLQYSNGPGQITLSSWGEAVPVDPSPFLVKFTPDSRFAIVNSMHKDANFRGTVISIQLAATIDTSGRPQHAIISHVEAGQLPEGLAISPDGRWVATANLEDSYLPVGDPKQQFFASLSLFHLDPATGQLTRVGEFPFDGVLPEPIVFDNSSHFIAAASFQRFDDPKAGGSIRFWRIADQNREPGRVELIEQSESVPLARGPQSMAIVR